MIGNLVLALGVALASGSALYEPQPHRAINHESNVVEDTIYSVVLNSDVYCFAQGTFTFARSDYNITSNGFRFILTTGGSIVFDSPSSLPTGLYDTIPHAFQFANWQSDTIGSNYCYGTIQLYVTDAYLIRFYVPINSSINGLQVDALNNQLTMFGVGDVNYTTATTSYYANEGNTSVVINDKSFMATSNDAHYTFGDFPLKFLEYWFIYGVNDDGNFGMKLSLLKDVDSNYDIGFSNGYSSGYTNGISTGYSNGYADGLRAVSSHNASWLGLMSSVADTPIRFLKQMFSFELFGMNVAVVILSCLTAIIIFGIVKKVWK